MGNCLSERIMNEYCRLLAFTSGDCCAIHSSFANQFWINENHPKKWLEKTHVATYKRFILPIQLPDNGWLMAVGEYRGAFIKFYDPNYDGKTFKKKPNFPAAFNAVVLALEMASKKQWKTDRLKFPLPSSAANSGLVALAVIQIIQCSHIMNFITIYSRLRNPQH